LGTPAPSTHRMWRLADLLHGIVYFAPERGAHYPALGLKGGWMGYFATRAAALGAAPPEVVTACFYNFAPAMVRRALPDAWTLATPEALIAARLRVFDDAFERMSGPSANPAAEDPRVAETAALATEIASACATIGRPLAAGHQGLAVPAEPRLKLFWACSVLREFRGDNHIIALADADVDGCEANVMMAALGKGMPNLQKFRGWSDAEWAAAAERLAERGWLAADGTVTDLGRTGREEIERHTDQLCASAMRTVTPTAMDTLADHLDALGATLR
jgi:hypothetical protein